MILIGVPSVPFICEFAQVLDLAGAITTRRRREPTCNLNCLMNWFFPSCPFIHLSRFSLFRVRMVQAYSSLPCGSGDQGKQIRFRAVLCFSVREVYIWYALVLCIALLFDSRGL